MDPISLTARPARRLRAALFASLGVAALAGCTVGPPPDAVPPPQAAGGPPPGYGGPAGYGEPSGYGAPSGYGGASGYAAPSGYGGPSGYAASGGYPPAGPAAYSPGPGGYAAAPGRSFTRQQYTAMLRRVAERSGRDPTRAAAVANRRFDMIDTDHDGVIQPYELQAWRAAHRGQARGPGPAGPGGYPGGPSEAEEQGPPPGQQWQSPPPRQGY